jgi:predicted nucleotidyltransferase component of viral defense system
MNPKIEVLEQIAYKLGREPALAEKDNFVVWIIKQLTGLTFTEGRLVFGGGTSLAKGYKIIQRFSEDIDFRFVSDKPLARNQKSKIKHKITDFLSSLDGFSFKEEPEAMNKNTLLKYNLKYPRDKAIMASSSLRPYIKIEVFFTDIHYPPMKCLISSLYNEYEKLPPETEFDCVALEDTAIDKISSFLWRIISRDKSQPIGSPLNDPSVIRHLYDLAFLKGKIKIDVKFKKLLLDTFKSDMDNRVKRTEDLKEVAEQVVATLESNNTYRQEYKRYVDDMSYEPDADKLSFDRAVEEFKRLMGIVV